jgi:hypothetical protein
MAQDKRDARLVEATDAEGHAIRIKATDDTPIEPEGGRRTPLMPDEPDDTERQPGEPDSGRFSDRNLKVAIIPVTW